MSDQNESLSRRIATAPQLFGLVALHMMHDGTRVADHTAVCQVTELACQCLEFPAAGSEVCLPELHNLTCELFGSQATTTSPRAFALTLPLLEWLVLKRQTRSQRHLHPIIDALTVGGLSRGEHCTMRAVLVCAWAMARLTRQPIEVQLPWPHHNLHNITVFQMMYRLMIK